MMAAAMLQKYKKVLIIDPPTGLFIREDRCQAPVNDIGVTIMRPSIESAYMAAVLEKAGCVCLMRDYSTEKKSWDDFRDDLVSFSPDVVVVNVTTPSVHRDMRACLLAKGHDSKVLTVGKGAHFLSFDQEILAQYPALDVVIRQEEELTALELISGKDIKDIAGITHRFGPGIVRNQDRAFIDNLDDLPFPARHLLKNELYVRLDTGKPQTTIQAARGCPARCVFCLAHKLSGHRLRQRSPENICDEIELCVREYNITSFFLRADTFTYDSKWVIRICEEICRRKLKIEWVCNGRADTLSAPMLDAMKKAGCYGMTMGIESGSQFILDKINKGIKLQQVRDAVRLCRQKGVFIDGYFMIGFPWDTPETVQETLNFALSLDLDAADFFIAYPFPGTDLFDIMRECDVFDPAFLESVPPYAGAAARTQTMTQAELLKCKRRMFRAFYFRPLFLFRTLFKFRSPATLLRCIRVGLGVWQKSLWPWH
ncbi:MAG: radical SAM protein [Candidatus Omnitrophota bacterium]